MKRADWLMVRACSGLRVHTRASIVGLAVVWMGVPSSAWGQSSWPSYPNNTAISVASGSNVGIGTTSPNYRLEATETGNLPGLNILANATSRATLGVGLNAAVTSGWILGQSLGNNSVKDFYIFDVSTGQARLYVSTTGSVGIGTTSPQYKLAVNGTIGAQDVIVTNTGWSDYVFRPGYRLRPLREVGAYIRAHRHLPDIPSEAEVKKRGVSVSDMQARLLAKIEELTLHMIQQEKDNRELREHMTRQKEENSELRERLLRLETRAASNSRPASGR